MHAQTVVERPSRAREVGQAAAGSPVAIACLGGVALAALSAALLPTVPSYDPWAWIVWGREIVDPHLPFAVSGGPSWKPLPVIFTTVFALFGGAAPTLWMILVRAGGLLGLLAAGRLASRLVGGGVWGAVAGALAAVAIVLSQDWGYYMLRGTSEPLLIASSLWAVDRFLVERHGSAFALAVATGLMRPEAWPFIGIYAIWLSVRQPRLRPLVLAGLASIPLFWFVPPWIGSGQPLLAAIHAHDYNGHLGNDPFLEVLRRGLDLQLAPVLVAAAVAVAVGRDRVTRSLALLTLAWWVVVVAMTLGGFPGLERFFLPASALACVLAGPGLVRLARAGGRVAAWLPWIAAFALVAACAPFAAPRVSVLRAQEPIAARAVTRLDQLSGAVTAVGGHRGVYPCRSSFAAINHSLQTALAWKLDVTLGRVGTSMRHQGLLFVGPHDTIDGIAPGIARSLTERRLVAGVGPWRVYRVSSPGADTRCVGR